MAEVKINSSLLKVAARVRQRSDELSAIALQGADQIANEVNASVIPHVYPGRVAESIEALPFESGGMTLARVRVAQKENNPLFNWYTYGTPPHFIEPHHRPISGGQAFLRFYWEAVGDTVNLPYVNHPGARSHLDKRDELMQEMAIIAREVWGTLLPEAIASAFNAGE